MADIGEYRTYIQELQRSVARGDATEHTHRPALKSLLEAARQGVVATNEPARIECGAPDFSVSLDGTTIGYVEAKDVGTNLDDIEKEGARANPSTSNGEQFKRYLDNLPNLLLTNYFDFRWYVNGKRRLKAALTSYGTDGALTADRAGIADTAKLLAGFFAQAPEPVSSAEKLAERLAQPTRMIRAILREAFTLRQESEDVRGLYEATRQTLVANLAVEDFSDMFAQTLAYGLFAARVNSDAATFRWSSAARDISAANPFLRQIFSLTAGLNADREPFIGFVEDMSQLLANSDMEAVLADFGKRGTRQDPIMHFYETFLAKYDPKLRERRGVYYTPEPIISYIARSVDYLLREHFDCADGLADFSKTEYETLDETDGAPSTKSSHRVLILDPACGTGSFLYGVIDHIRETYRAQANAGMWNGYVKEHLLPRIFGFELMMAPYAMAHLKLGMQLSARDMPEEERGSWVYEFDGSERLGVYLTNSLEQAEPRASEMFGPMRVITEEANAAARIKRDLPIMVVIGNPPYSGHSSNASRRNGALTWIGELVEDYKQVDGAPLGERNPKWLQDDYVKFIRFGQWRIQQSGSGILAFITNHSYLDNPTFRGMRQQLMDTFTDIYLLDLHGNALKKERAPDGGADANVFDIRQGVAIALFVKEPGKGGGTRVHHAALYGEREGKYQTLSETDVSSTKWEPLRPRSPNYLFKPWDYELAEEYERWPKITDVMPVNSAGVLTARDKLTIQNTPEEVKRVVTDFAGLPAEVARSKYALGTDARDWKVVLAQDDLESSGLSDDRIVPILYRPFDTRYTYYTGNSRGFICMPRQDIMRHTLSGENLALMTTRRVERQDSFDRVFVGAAIGDGHSVSLKEISYQFPLYTYPSEQEIAQGLYGRGERQPNLSNEFTADLGRRLGLSFVADGCGDLSKTFGPEDALHYVYAVLHSTTYRERYDQFLRADFPRVPLTDDQVLFSTLVALGARLVDAHLLRSVDTAALPVAFPQTGDNVVAKAHPKYFAPGETPPGEQSPIVRGRVYISANNRRNGARGQYFDGVPPKVWDSHVGGYQPMEKWLKDRRDRALAFDDLAHYTKIAAALQDTIRLIGEIDAALRDLSTVSPLFSPG